MTEELKVAAMSNPVAIAALAVSIVAIIVSVIVAFIVYRSNGPKIRVLMNFVLFDNYPSGQMRKIDTGKLPVSDESIRDIILEGKGFETIEIIVQNSGRTPASITKVGVITKSRFQTPLFTAVIPIQTANADTAYSDGYATFRLDPFDDNRNIYPMWDIIKRVRDKKGIYTIRVRAFAEVAGKRRPVKSSFSLAWKIKKKQSCVIRKMDRIPVRTVAQRFLNKITMFSLNGSSSGLVKQKYQMPPDSKLVEYIVNKTINCGVEKNNIGVVLTSYLSEKNNKLTESTKLEIPPITETQLSQLLWFGEYLAEWDSSIDFTDIKMSDYEFEKQNKPGVNLEDIITKHAINAAIAEKQHETY